MTNHGIQFKKHKHVTCIYIVYSNIYYYIHWYKYMHNPHVDTETNLKVYQIY